MALTASIGRWLMLVIVMLSITPADSDLPVYSPNLHIDRGSRSTTLQGEAGVAEDGKESCECEDDFPPGAGFAFRREGYAMVNLEAGKETRQRTFFENARLTFKEILVPGDGKTLPQAGQRAMLRYTEFTSNECLPDTKTQPRIENVGQLDRDDTEHSVLTAVDGLEDLVKKMSIGEKAMFFTSFDLGYVRDLQAWLQWWLEATCSEMVDGGARIFEVQLVHLYGETAQPRVKQKSFSWF